MNKIEAVGHRVLIEPKAFARATDWGFQLDTSDTWARERSAAVVGTIVDIGPNAWKDFTPGTPWAKVGDVVYFAKYSGKEIKEGDDIRYIIVNDEDIQAIVHEVGE